MKGKRKRGRGPAKVVGQPHKEGLTYNPHLKATILEVVDNQIRDGEPPETRQTFERLVAAGYAEDQAKEMIGSAVVEDIWGMLHEGRMFDRERFAGFLEKLG